MPKATIHKYDKFPLAKSEVWFSKYRHMPPPTRDFSVTKDFEKNKFGVFVPKAAYSRHDFRTFLLSKNVRHVCALLGENCQCGILNLLSSQSSTTFWSSIVARRIWERSKIRFGFGGLAFCNPSLQFVQTARRLPGESSPPFDLSIICPMVSRTVLDGVNGSGSPAAKPHIWHVYPLRSRT